MIIKTKPLGEVEINENEVIAIVDGIFGFPKHTKFVILMKEEEAPFGWLQSVEEPNLAFVVIDPFLFKYNYKLKVGQDYLKKVQYDAGIDKFEEVLSYAIVVIPEDNPQRMTANLQGPIIINARSRLACQAISDNPDYSVRHYIMDDFKEKQSKEGVK